MPYFSIIIPVYNVAPYLRECLDSVLAQTFTDWEAICVDDGSTDGSGEILDEYAAKDKRFRVIHQKNAGVSAARNVALDETRGEWLEFIDADDSIVPDALSRFVSVANKADVVFFGCIMTLRDGFRRAYILPDWAVSPVEESTAAQISSLAFNALGDVFGWTWDKFIRRDVVERFHIRFDRAISFFEDELFTLEVMNVAESFATLSDCLYRYRQTADGLTAQGASDFDVLGETFMRVGTKLNNSGLRKIAFSRAQTWLRRSAYRGFRLKTSRSLILLYRMASDVFGTDSSYNNLMCVLCRFPVWAAKFLLAVFHLFHK